MKLQMKNYKIAIGSATTALALALVLVGCAREVSHTETTKVSNDGTVKTKDQKVIQSSDGTVTKTEESKTTRP